MIFTRRMFGAGTFVFAASITGCAVSPVAPSNEQRKSLAPTGPLKVGVHASSTTKGVIIELGRALAKALDVEFELVEVKTQGELLAGIAAGKIDFSGTNASPARMTQMDFSATVLDIELGYMVVAGSRVTTIAEIDLPGVRVGVNQGSTSLTTLPKILKKATVVPLSPSKTAGQMLLAKEIDAFATNKSILLDLSGGIPGSRILDGNWGVEHWAVCIPKGRTAGLAYFNEFVASAHSTGLVRAAAEKVGLGGSVLK